MRKTVLVFAVVALLFTGMIATITAPTVASSNGMVAAVNNYAAEAGAKILEMGGNAVDAAIAVSLALGVVEPYASGIGGEGYAVITMADGSKFAIDFRSTAPMLATYEALTEKGLRIGTITRTPMGICVPGVLAGIREAWLLGATLPFSVLAQPAIDLARNGFLIDQTFSQTTADNYELLLKNAFEFLNEGFVWETGTLYKNPELADTLERIVEEGIDTFYFGSLADEIEEFMIETDGFMRKSDLEIYNAIIREPLHGTYRGYDLFVPHPPVSGPQLLAVLNTLENFNLPAMSWDDPLAIHIIQQALILGDVDRRTYISDPDFHDLPYEGFMSKDYAKTRFMAISMNKTLDYPYTNYLGDAYPFQEGATYQEALLAAVAEVASNASDIDESPSTTHFSIVDKDGNAVAWTQTLSSFFGTTTYFKGFFFNNEMGNYASSYRPGDVINLTGGMRPRTTICPTVIMKDGEVRWVVGTPGGARIMSMMVNLVVELIDFNLPVDKAIRLPKFTGMWNDTTLRIEAGYPETTLNFLEKVLGHKLNIYNTYPDLYFGGPNIIAVEENGMMIGAGSIRRGGFASAPEF